MRMIWSVYTRILLSAGLVSCLQMRVYSQNWEHTHDSLSFSAFDAKSGTLLEASPNGYRLFRRNNQHSQYISLPGIGTHKYDFVFPSKQGPSGSEWLLLQYQGGITHQLTNKGLERIDTDYLNRMTITMQAFIRNDTIHFHGGYGFWSARNHISFLNRRTGKWELRRLSETSENPPGILNHWAVLMGDSLFTFGGNTIDPYDPLHFLNNTSLWIYNFQKREWHNLGEVDQRLGVPNDHYPTLQIGKKVIKYPVDGLTAELDFESMKIRFREPTSANIDMFRKMHRNTKPFVENDRLYYCRITDNKIPDDISHQSEWVSVKIPELLGTVVSEEELVKSGITISWWWFVIPLVLGGFLIVMRKRNRATDKIVVTDDGFRYKQAVFAAGSDSIRIVRLLLNSEGPVSNSEIMELIGSANLDYSHNIRVKNQLVDKTNIQLRSILQIQDDLITCERSNKDKRARTYSIRKEYFN